MPVLTVTKSYSDGNTLTESMLDDIKSSIETFINTTKLDDSNIQTSGVSSDNLAAASVTATKIAADAVTTTKILDANVTAAKLASDSVITTKILDANVTTAKLADAAVTAAKITDATITGAKIAAATIAYSNVVAVNASASSAQNFTTATTGAWVSATSISVTLTTTGKPVVITLQPGPTDTASYLLANDGGHVRVLRDGVTSLGTNSIGGKYAPGSFTFIDEAPSAGSHTWQLQVKHDSSSWFIVNTRILAYELI